MKTGFTVGRNRTVSPGYPVCNDSPHHWSQPGDRILHVLITAEPGVEPETAVIAVVGGKDMARRNADPPPVH